MHSFAIWVILLLDIEQNITVMRNYFYWGKINKILNYFNFISNSVKIVSSKDFSCKMQI